MNYLQDIKRLLWMVFTWDLKWDQKAMIMKTNNNREKVLANDKDIPRQIPLILTDKTGVKKPQELRNEELFYRAIGR